MPGFELIGASEKKQLNHIFTKANGVMFRHGFEKLRNNNFFTEKFESKFAKKFKLRFSLAVTSGSAALRVAIAGLKIPKKSEIITQAFTFVATVEAIVESGCIPVCTEIDKSLNMCPVDLERKITKKTKAVIVVHMLGVAADLNKIKKICSKYKLLLIEDTAWGIGGKYKSKYLGTIGDAGTFSFDFAKTITTGEGGMCVFKKKRHYAQAKAWHDHGHENNPKFPRWEDTRKSSGFNFRITELQSAVGLAQLEKFNDIYKHHEKNKQKLFKVLKNFKNIKFRQIFKDTKPASEAIVFFVKNKKIARLFRLELLKVGISTKILPEALTWHFALHWKHINELKKWKNQYSKSIKILSKAVSLPIFCKMENSFYKKVERVCRKVFNEI